MCLACAATQAPVCATVGPCAAGIGQIASILLLVLSIALGTARLWLHAVTAKIAPFLNIDLTKQHHEKK